MWVERGNAEPVNPSKGEITGMRWELEYVKLERDKDFWMNQFLQTKKDAVLFCEENIRLRKALEEAREEAKQGQWGDLERADAAIRNIETLCSQALEPAKGEDTQ